jgi:hypothetical protein
MAVLGALVLAAAVLGTAYAAEPDRPEKRKDRPDVVAVALGVLKEPGGDQAVVDFRAAKNGDNVRGNLRFYSKDDGYYNGAVRRFAVQDGVIKAAGAGGLLKPDGTRVPVRFEAEFHVVAKKVSIKVTGKGGFEYTLEGTFDPGFIKILNPQDRERKR